MRNIVRGIWRYLMNDECPDMFMNDFGYLRAMVPIAIGLLIIYIFFVFLSLLPGKSSAIAVGILSSVVICYVVLMAMPRATQFSIMGAALGVSADAGYAKMNEETPITIANALVKLTNSIVKAIDIVSVESGGEIIDLVPYGVWSFILSSIVFMILSFLVKHDG